MECALSHWFVRIVVFCYSTTTYQASYLEILAGQPEALEVLETLAGPETRNDMRTKKSTSSLELARREGCEEQSHARGLFRV